ncbi:hypothetical protein DPMN_107869 [Dreissena polymorpha]|uniref:Uncharacterized protein n=1 Tax=Dreissena polymorpha TaxID=45954 RepID=A0A9D4QLD7_DREPO|nr:hypothetical protein DPMN_107869 [Dreissena polymorpha]
MIKGGRGGVKCGENNRGGNNRGGYNVVGVIMWVRGEGNMFKKIGGGEGVCGGGGIMWGGNNVGLGNLLDRGGVRGGNNMYKQILGRWVEVRGGGNNMFKKIGGGRGGAGVGGDVGRGYNVWGGDNGGNHMLKKCGGMGGIERGVKCGRGYNGGGLSSDNHLTDKPT